MPNHDASARRNGPGGLRKLATLQTLANGAKPRERHQMANRFARLENERARLERELSTWENCMRATATKLAKVNAEIAALRVVLLGPGTKRAPMRDGHGQRRALAETQLRESAAPRHRAMTLDY